MASEQYRKDRIAGWNARDEGRPLSDMQGRAQREGWRNRDQILERAREYAEAYGVICDNCDRLVAHVNISVVAGGQSICRDCVEAARPSPEEIARISKSH